MNTNKAPENGSYFDGGLLELLGLMIIGGILCSFTLGLMFPWLITKIYEWQINHTVVQGKRLAFNGRARNLFGKFIIWTILSAITFGIYSLWMGINMEKWKAENTSFA